MSRTRTTIAALLHAALAALCWTWFDFSTLLTNTELAYLAVGSLVLGALPAVLLTSKRLRTPSVVVATLFALSAYGTWSVVSAGLTPVDPTPFGWYLLGWPAVAAAALLVGGGEYGFRRYRQPTTNANGTAE
ncbi:hypothetical protein SAMN04487949_3121 [Halogranum gelatinilyticum]|uniref:Uncharacterized protein n=1 Tax=Halogranum gelatinilyticum TaxID=660521 RepID=A0A1G9XTA5_9EURY|nr:hypothetical protein [Halogranum gelatinilyticum]SDN00052.1 hypothetical protein SAMN04487949_3121 [Halogranum gelatinilyticum]